VKQLSPARFPAVPQASWQDTLGHWIPKLVVAPTFLAMILFIYGYIAWTGALSLTNSRFLPSYDFIGLIQYEKLFDNDRWLVACTNLVIFGGLFILICIAIGVMMAILLDQRIRQEGALRTIYLYPWPCPLLLPALPGAGCWILVWDLKN
jgi:glucose/mannose transport system permease protein